jgi:type IV pilus assembly protein PilW
MMRTLAYSSSLGGHHPEKAQGFSLVEIMVALVIGMIGVLVIMQVASTGEAQRRVTTGAGEAQNNASLGIYAVERDIRQAGYGYSSLSVIGCQMTVPARGALAAYTLGVLAPIIVNSNAVPAGDDDSDTLLIVHGSSSGSPEGDVIVVPTLVGGDQHLLLASAVNFQKDEWVVAAPPIPTAGCHLKMGKIKDVYLSLPPDSGGTVVVPSDVDAQDDGLLFDFGLSPRIAGYAIRGGNLTTCDYLQTDCSQAGNWTVVASGIVSLRAQYGHGGSAWDQANPVIGTGSQEAFAQAWAGISALRFALVARNGEWNKDEVTSGAPAWAGSASAPVDLSGRGDWMHYRYQVYETVVPLRNIPWMGS